MSTNFNRKAKLGGSGLGLYMLAMYQKRFHDTRYADQARRLCRHLVSDILDTGEFMYYHVYLDQRMSPDATRFHGSARGRPFHQGPYEQLAA